MTGPDGSDVMPNERLILQHIAHDTDSRDGWCRWSTSDRWPWEWDDYRPLVARGLLDRRETWKDILLRLTDDGWAALSQTPPSDITALPPEDEAR